MATLTYNGESNPQKMLTFTEIPNILKYSDYVDGGKAEVVLSFNGNLQSGVTADSQYSITFMGDTVTNVMNPQNNNNKRFYISSSASSTAMNVARALRACGRIGAEYNVIVMNSYDVHIIAKDIGEKWGNLYFFNYFITNIPSMNMAIQPTDGYADSASFGSKINVDVFASFQPQVETYVTTLEKNFYGEECSFDMSPILETMSQYGMTIPYSMQVSMVNNSGDTVNNGVISGLTTFGYSANQSDKFLTADSSYYLGNITRGDGKPITMYTYDNVINYSVLCGSAGWMETLRVKNSIGTELYTSSSTGHHTWGTQYIQDKTWTIPSQYMQRGNYIELTIGVNTVRYEIISPLNASEYFQRILWRNEYGGISFFDFTSSRSESDSVDTETYEKNVLDYYDSNDYESKKIYSIDYGKSVSLKSHLMDENGKYIFNSLMRSKKVWTVIGGKTYYIIPKSISVEEDGTYNGIYTAKLTYEYSDL